MRHSSTLAQISLILCMVAIGAGPMILGAIRPWIYLPPFLLLSIASLIGLYRGFKAIRTNYWRPDWIDASVFLFITYAIGRYYFSPTEYDSRLEILKILTYGMTFFLGRYGFERRIHGMVILYSLIVIGVGVSIFGFFLKANPSFHPYGETFHLHYMPRMTSTYGCPNHLGYFLVITTSIALSIGFFSHLSWVPRIITLYSCIPMIAVIGFTLSRGSWIALAFALLAITIMAVRLEKLKKWIPITIFLLLVSGGAFFVIKNQGFNQRLLEGFDPETLKVNAQYCRVQLLIDSIKIWKDHPYFGTGPGTFIYTHPRYQGSNYPSLAVFAHNDYANTIADYGAIGLFLALLFVVGASFKLCRSPERGERWHDRIFQSSAAAAMLALIIHSLFDFNLHIPANALIFFMIVGMGLRNTNEPFEQTSLTHFRFLPIYLAAGFWIFTSVLFFKTAYAYYPFWSLQRQNLITDWNQRVKEIEIAADKDPQSTAIAYYLGDVYRLEASKHQEKEVRYPYAYKAIYWYQKALTLNPLDDTISIRLAMSYDLMERYMEAYQHYKSALKNQPYSGYFWVELGTHYWRQGLLLQAKEMYEGALACPYRPDNIYTELEVLDQTIEKARQQIKEKSAESISPKNTPSNN